MSQVNINKTEALLTTATPDPVPDTLVLRDNVGNISANVITGTVSGTTANANLLTYLPPATAATANTVAVRDASGNLTANTFNGALNGNASTASQLATAQTIALTGAVAGSASFNGSAGITINTVPSTLSSQILHLDDAQFSTTALTSASTTVKTFRFAQDSTHPVTTLDVYASAWQPPIIIPVGTNPQAIAVNPNTGKVYVANAGSGTVSVLSGSSVTATITVGSNPQDIAVNPSTNYIYTANNGSNTVSVISGGSNTVVSTITVQTGPTGIAVNPNTNTIYAVNYTSGSVSTINGANNTVTTTITGLTTPYRIAVNPNTNYIYVVNTGVSYPNFAVYIISGSSNTIVDSFTTSRIYFPGYMAFNPNTNILAITNSSAYSFSTFYASGSTLIDSNGYSVTSYTSNPSVEIGVAFNTSTNLMYMGLSNNQILVATVNSTSISNVKFIPISANNGAIYVAVNSNTNQVYLTFDYLNEVAVLDMNTYLQLNANVDGTNTLTLTQSAVTEEQIFALKGLSVPSTDGIHTLNLQLSTSNASYSAYTQLLEVYQND